MDLFIVPIAVLLVVVLVYGLVTAMLLRRCRLPESDVETVVVELPTVGHHVALHHYPAHDSLFREPVLLCHGLGANRFNMDFTDDGTGSDRLSLARALARAGFDTWLLELRGRGKARVPRGAEWTMDDEIREDLPFAIESVLARTRVERVFWVGHSWGGMLQLALQAKAYPAAAKVAGMVTIASPATLRHHHARTWLLRTPALFLVAAAGRLLPLSSLARIGLPLTGVIQWVGSHFRADLRTIDLPVLRRVLASLVDDISPGVIRQALGWLRSGRLTELDGTAYEASFSRITTPMLLLSGSDDPVAPPESIAFVTHEVAGDDTVHETVGKATGYSADYGHGGLLLAKNAPEEVFPRIIEWLASRATRRNEPERGHDRLRGLVSRAAGSFRVGKRRQARGTETRQTRQAGQNRAPRGSSGALTREGRRCIPERTLDTSH